MAFLRSPFTTDRSFETLSRTLGRSLPRRRVLTLLAATLASGVLAPRVDAKRRPANGASIASRVQGQKELCDIGGGTFDESKTAFGSTITTCTGGDGGAGTCVNTEKSTECYRGLTRPPENVNIPPIGGVYDPPTSGGGVYTPPTGGGGVYTSPTGGGGGGTWVTDGSATSGVVARAAADERAHPSRKHPGKGKQRRAGGKGRK
jgi:hypothetical protein